MAGLFITKIQKEEKLLQCQPLYQVNDVPQVKDAPPAEEVLEDVLLLVIESNVSDSKAYHVISDNVNNRLAKRRKFPYKR